MEEETEWTYDIPKGWRWVKLGSVCRINRETRNPSRKMPDEEFLYLDIASIEAGTGRIKGPKRILGKDAPSRARRVVHQGDVIMSTVRPYLKAFALVPAEYDNQICSTGFAVLSCDAELLPKFLLYALFSDMSIEQCNKMMSGAHYPALTAQQVSEIVIPLPPLSEQLRIVTRLEELLGRIDEVENLRRQALSQSKVLMTSTLHQVFSRADEKGWMWERLGDVIKEDRKTINPQKFPDTRFWHLTMDCIESNTGRLLSKIFLQGRNIMSTKYYFDSKHILYGKLRPYLNKVYSVREGEEGICTTEFIPFVAINADKDYVAYYLRTKYVVDFAMSNLTGTRQPRTNIDNLLELQIPLPPISEQKQIAAFLNRIEEQITTLQGFQADTQKEIEKLRTSLLYKAFTGEL